MTGQAPATGHSPARAGTSGEAVFTRLLISVFISVNQYIDFTYHI